jgi:hypothetical protein
MSKVVILDLCVQWCRDPDSTDHLPANAIRDYQLVLSLDRLSPRQKDERHAQTVHYFPITNKSDLPDVAPFESANYWCLPRTNKQPLDQVREFLRQHLPNSISWSREEKNYSDRAYKAGNFLPEHLSRTAEVLARFLVAMIGALFILVPIYIMAIHTSRDKNLVTTTVAVVLFATVCSVTLRTTYDQTLGATAAYAAVLVVFVGLTTRSSGG